MGGRYRDYLREILRGFLPGHVLMASEKDDERFPLLRQREKEGETLIYLCRDYVCRQPAADPAEFRAMTYNRRPGVQ